MNSNNRAVSLFERKVQRERFEYRLSTYAEAIN